MTSQHEYLKWMLAVNDLQFFLNCCVQPVRTVPADKMIISTPSILVLEGVIIDLNGPPSFAWHIHSNAYLS